MSGSNTLNRGCTYVSGGANDTRWYDREFKRGYDEAKRQFDSPYVRGYRTALEEMERREAVRKSVENKDYWL